MRSAQLRLRSGEHPLGAQLVWPPAPAAGLLILLVDADAAAAGERLCRAVSEALGVVALSAVCAGPDDGAAATEWAADHAAQLGAGGAPLLLAGVGAGADVAAALAIQAAHDGWPGVAHQILIHPRAGAPAPTAGVAPATIVGRDGAARAYAARLRQAGVPVDVLDDVELLPDQLAARLR